MPRDRSKSVVQRIASEVPSYSKDELKLEGEATDAKNLHNPTIDRTHSRHDLAPTTFTAHQRSSSFSVDVKNEVNVEVLAIAKELTYPFTDAERDQMVLNFLDSLNYNSVLDSDHIDSINEMFDDQILSFKADCDFNIGYFRDLIKESKAVLDNLTTLTIQYDKVTKDTLDFAAQSSALLKDQDELEKKAQQMDHVLQMFEPLEGISKMLISSGNHIIRTGKISSILRKLQECLDFLDVHDNYKDSEFYTIRYRQCMTRGLTLVRNFLIEYLKNKQTDISQQLQDKDLSALKFDILMYSGFTGDLEKQDENTRFSVLISSIVDKCGSHKEYRGLVSDVLQQYFKLRLQLIQFYIQQQQNASQGQEQVSTLQYCQKSIASFKKLLEREYVLFHKFFPVQNFVPLEQGVVYDELYRFFKQALEPLYDEVRNRVLREVNIAELCHLTNLLTSYYEFEEDVSVVTAYDNKIEYGELFEPMLNDSQARLIFRIQNFIDNRLVKYKPNPEDLQLGSRRKTGDGHGRKNSALNEFDDNLFPELYVPVGIALTVLSNIYELVNSMVFDDLAHYIIHSCIYMLKNGAVKLAVAHLGPVDAKLFYLKNLMMLKNQLNNFDIQFVRTETTLDFTSGIQELIQIFRNGQLYVKFNEKGGLLELVKKSVPKVVNDMIDAKHEIELELSNSVNEFVTECTNSICAPILGESKLTTKERAIQMNDNILMKLPQIQTQIKLFIDEEEIVRYLLDMLSNLISSTYEAYYKTLEEKITKKIISGDEMEDIMEPDSFYNFLSETVASLKDQAPDTDPIHFNEDLLREFDSPAPEVQWVGQGEPFAATNNEVVKGTDLFKEEEPEKAERDDNLDPKSANEPHSQQVGEQAIESVASNLSDSVSPLADVPPTENSNTDPAADPIDQRLSVSPFS